MPPYVPRIATLLEQIGSTPTGWPLIDWVHLHWPRIAYGMPITGGAFAYPWPLARIVIRDAWGEEWQRETLAHELAHLIRWRGHLVGSLEQEYDAYLIGARVRCEWNGWDWQLPHPKAVERYPLFFGPDADRVEFMRRLPERLPFYAVLPWSQPRDPLAIGAAMAHQGLFGARQLLTATRARRGGKRPGEARKGKK